MILTFNDFYEYRKKIYVYDACDGNYADDYDRNIIDFALNNNIELFIDIGSNIGKNIKNIKSDVKIIAIEPNKKVFEELKNNCKDNKNITFYNCGVWSKNCKKILSYDDRDSTQGSVTYLTGTSNQRIKMIKLDNLFNKIKSYNSILIKVDSEGAEPEILKGMKRIISQDKQIMLIFEYSHKWQASIRELNNFLYTLASNDFVLYRTNGFGLEQLGTTRGLNIIGMNYTNIVALKKIRIKGVEEVSIFNKAGSSNMIVLNDAVEVV